MKPLPTLSTIIAVCLLCTWSSAQEPAQPKSIEALQREVRALEARLQALSAAAKEVAELTMRSAAVWSRALGDEKEPSGAVAKSGGKPKPAAQRPRPVAAPAPEVAAAVVRGKVKVPAGEPIAYVYVENVFAPPRRGETVVIDQKNKNFVPSWAVIRRGTSIEFPNHDNVYHNVFSHAVGNAFDLGLYNAGTPAKSHAFQSPGAVDIYCNIHPNMAASVLVVPNDLFAKVQPDGSFVIRDVPVGQRKIVAWSPSTALATQWVELKAEGASNVELSLVLKSRTHKNKEGRAYGSYE
jgi:plastocyanin